MTIREVFDNVIQTLMIEKANNSPEFIRTRVVDDINAALQFMTSGIDYFAREVATINIGLATPTAAMPEDTLNVFGPLRLGTGEMLTEVTSRGEFDQFAQIYLGYKNASPTGRPYAYFVDKLHRDGDPNSIALTARFTPLPAADYSVQCEISRRPASYTVADLSDPSPEIPVPHNFAESILLPLVRWNVRTSHFFNSPNILASMEQEYQAALVQLGIAQPTQGDVTNDALGRKKAAARAAARDAYNSTQ